jgi:GNAT superfamily N-acetyltransferase
MAIVSTFDPAHPLWTEYVCHLERVGMARWALLDGAYNPDCYYLGVIEGEKQIVGHLSIQVQSIDLPGMRSLTETFVNTFAVEPTYRRRGYGRALQQEALCLSRNLHCYQMRSWSAEDHPENYALKLSLGFGIHPAVFETSTGEKVKGVYFVKTTE